MNIAIDFWIFELVQVSNFTLNLPFWFFGPNLPEKNISGQKQKWTASLNYAYSRLGTIFLGAMALLAQSKQCSQVATRLIWYRAIFAENASNVIFSFNIPLYIGKNPVEKLYKVSEMELKTQVDLKFCIIFNMISFVNAQSSVTIRLACSNALLLTISSSNIVTF